MTLTIDWTSDSNSRLSEVIYDRLTQCLRRLGRTDTLKIEMILVDEPTMAELVRKHSDKEGATDVLSFPIPKNPDNLLGSIIICNPVAARQAERAGISFEQEVSILAEHGLLHLLGYNHA